MYIYGTHLGLGRLGQDDTSDQFSVNIPQTTITLPSIPAAYSDTSTFTGLPLYLEIGLGMLGTYLLVRATQRTTQRVRAGVRAARRAK
jgi:hypothetical protein